MQADNTTFKNKLITYKQIVSHYLDSLISQEKPASLYEPIKYALNGNGKRLRPILLLLTTEVFGGDVEKAIPAAGAIEILHNFTLVHDDIMDNDETRRGMPTVHNKWDTDVALLAGDGMVALAYQSLLRTSTERFAEIHKLFTECILELCEGQALDKEFEGRENVSMAEYIEMISKKTGCLLGMCARMGAVLAGENQEDISALRVYGESLGIAFQIQDDLLDITSSEKVLGKDFGSDIKSKKKTFLLIHALEHANASQRNAIWGHLQQNNITKNEIYHIRQLFEEIGSIKCAYKTVEHYINKAKQNLSLLSSQTKIEDLAQFLSIILKRKF
jgi:geranylgeranyl diphosphate synthase type II